MGNNTSVMADMPLCKTCSAMDLKRILREGLDQYTKVPIFLGALAAILSRKTTCGLCRMISLLISRNWSLHLYPDVDLSLVTVHLVARPCGWADTNQYDPDKTTIYAHRIRLLAVQPAAITKKVMNKSKENYLELQMMEDDAARFGRGRAFHGRKVGAAVSIDLVRKWLQICEKEHACASILGRNDTRATSMRCHEMCCGGSVIPRKSCQRVASPANKAIRLPWYGPFYWIWKRLAGMAASVWPLYKQIAGRAAVVRPLHNEQLPQGARMIDVIDMALVEAHSNCRYITLSYVWGDVIADYKTLLRNVAERHKKYSLKKVVLPRTIRDAIKLVQELQERYLWVDALCIIQDDPVNMKAQIEGMHMIYGMATLTIIAAGGNSADARLPGLEPGSRKELQHIETIQSLQLAVPLKPLLKTVSESVWDSRAWTFQEQILSRRKLFFTNEQLFFQCQREVFSEDVIVESSKERGVYPSQDQCLIQLHPPKRHVEYEREELYESFADEFMRVIDEYTRRQLTNPGDIYNAVFAIITVLSRDYEITPVDPKEAFLFGMPLSVLESAMLWQPGLDAPTHARRVVEGLVAPSWSWAGWIGNVVYDSNLSNGFMHGFPGSCWKGSLVDEWVIGNVDGVARRIYPDSTERGGPTSLNGRTAKYIGLPNPPTASLVEKGERLVPGTLLFRTTATIFRVQKFDMQMDEYACNLGIRNYSKCHSVFKILSDTSPPAVAGTIVLPSDTDTTVPVESVVLSRATSGGSLSHQIDKQVFGAYSRDYPLSHYLNVMVVKRVGTTMDGMEISERVGVGYILEQAWIVAGFRERVVRLQ